ncbi:hypothetical protein BST81_16870 [Leptolyngbya sp. 'hensonii']|uniref:hypothetical protein n=1 Tax=Leptolyngbya sp. 'hensonii' TaxID=1922337 RepID=UPI00094FC148|nr:hypothetical protein [Leptolyngbya sp. 'hensonii']OLP17462.1 hypothetical protein BST81_16870 [Leptolyngbya sp. 'hensonii']
MKAQSKLKPTTVDTGRGRLRITPIENELKLSFILQMELRGRTVAAYVLAEGDSLKFVFGWDCAGIHASLTSEQVAPVFEAIESGLKDLLPNERLTVHLSSFTSDADRQAELDQLFAQAPSKPLKFLIYSEKQRVQELTQAGIRKPKSLKLYATYTLDGSSTHGKPTDVLEKILGKLYGLWHQAMGDAELVEQQSFEIAFTKAFSDGYLLWEQMLKTRMGLRITPMTAEDLWQHLWRQFNTTAAPPIPQLVVMTEQGLVEQVNSTVHLTTILLERHESLPVADRQWVHVKGNYVAPLVLMDKPGGWASKKSQLRYLWEVLSREMVYDTEIFCQLSQANLNLVKQDMMRLTKQAIISQDQSTKTRSIDVKAGLNQRKAVSAQEQLYEGAIPLHVAVVMLVHRPTQTALEEATTYIQNCFRRPAWVDHEKEYAWRIWLQTLPIAWENLLATPFNRRQVYLTGEAPGLMPLVSIRPVDRTGFELLAEEGGVPVYLDFFSQIKRLGIFATTRGGKSVLVSGLLTHALAQGMKIVALDFPKPDGSSTFTDYTAFMGDQGAYFDISTQSNNLFQRPDFRGLNLDAESLEARRQDWIAFIESALMVLILGSGSGATNAQERMLRQTVRTIVNIVLLSFLSQPDIITRYDAAEAAGIGTPDWENTPTLADFLAFFDRGDYNLNLEVTTGDIHIAFQQIKLRLRFWLESRVGRAISRPSTFRADADLLVFALRNLSDAEDAAVLALSAYAAALNRALSSPASIFFIDEAPILFEFEEIAALVARLFANGAKAGVRVFLSAQDPDTIARSPSAPKILQNMDVKLIGRIQPAAVKSFIHIFGYAPELIGRNASESFFPNPAQVYSQWMLDNQGLCTYCRYYPAFVQLAAVANNPHEQLARTTFMQMAPDPLQGLHQFSRELVSALRDSRPIQLPKQPVASLRASAEKQLEVPTVSGPT